MKKLTILALCVCMLLSVPVFAFEAIKKSGGVTDAELAKEGLTLVHSSAERLTPDMPEWRFKMYGKKAPGEDYFEEMLLFISDADGGTVYKGPLKEVFGQLEGAYVMLTDVNFDGHKDVLYTEGPTGTRGYYWYHLLLWDDVTKTLIPSESFSEICNPVVDAENKAIRSSGANSAFEEEYSVHFYQNGIFNMFKKITLTFEENNGVESRIYEIYSYESGTEKLDDKVECVGPFDKSNPEESQFWGPNSIWYLDNPIWDKGRKPRMGM